MAGRPPLPIRRLRALWRRAFPEAVPATAAPRGRTARVHGFVDGCFAGEIRGWAVDPDQPGRRVHVIALNDGQVVAETLADLPRTDLVQAGRGDGRHGFRLRLPPALQGDEPHIVEVLAIAGGTPAPLNRGEVTIAPPAEAAVVARPREGLEPAPSEPETPAQALVLALWPSTDPEAAPPSDWGALGRSGGRLVRLGQAGAPMQDLASAHTVIFARAGDQLDPRAGVLFQRSRALADVLTWDGTSDASRRPEARALGLLLGESLGGAFALRGHALHLLGGDFTEALAHGDIRRAELLLAGRPELRWMHLPGRVAEGPGGEETALSAASMEGLSGFRWAGAEGLAPGRLIPNQAPRLLTVAVWPKRAQPVEASLRSLLTHPLSDMALEVLVPAAKADHARGLVETLGLARASVRGVDPPAMDTPGAWLTALAAAASGEAVIVCQAGVRLDPRPGAVEEIAAWALSPLVGAVTVPISRGAAAPLAGLAVERTDKGWAVGSAFAPDLHGRSRPVLAAPAAFLAVGRNKLAMLGGAAAERLPAGGVDLDLGLRLRRLGTGSVLLGHLSAEGPANAAITGEMAGVPLAAFQADELAAAAAAYPVPRR